MPIANALRTRGARGEQAQPGDQYAGQQRDQRRPGVGQQQDRDGHQRRWSARPRAGAGRTSTARSSGRSPPRRSARPGSAGSARGRRRAGPRSAPDPARRADRRRPSRGSIHRTIRCVRTSSRSRRVHHGVSSHSTSDEPEQPAGPEQRTEQELGPDAGQQSPPRPAGQQQEDEDTRPDPDRPVHASAPAVRAPTSDRLRDELAERSRDRAAGAARRGRTSSRSAPADPRPAGPGAAGGPRARRPAAGRA